MNSRERIKAIIAGEKPDRCAFWLGMPHEDSWPSYYEYFGITGEENVRRHLQDDMRWICAEFGSYKHPEGKPLFNMIRVGISGEKDYVFADCEDLDQVEAYDWPNPDYLDFIEVLDRLKNAGEVYRASGMWSSFFHIVADLFGMENYFIKMYTNPEVVDAVTRKVCEFYLEANYRFFELAGAEVDAFFMGNDYGTQLDLFVNPQQWERFHLPYTKKMVDMAHSYGYQVMHHSCGAVHKILQKFIDIGVNAIHPIQAKAISMDAETLAKDFKGKIAFVGGIDTQDLLVRGTPDQVREEVRRVKGLLGPLVVSPSHEALLPNVPPENIVAMAEAAIE
ncbi:MAG: uroporphyrinogen decarboxylase family protein [Armatimonadota bacterium]|nr:uroporphyrinogen decarboxylase family protein [bacterium]